LLIYNKKAGKSGPVAPKRKMAENLHSNNRHWPKIYLNPNFLGYSIDHKQGKICVRFNGLNKSWQKVLAFLKFDCVVVQKLETSKNNRFSVSIHFQLTALLVKNFHLRLRVPGLGQITW